VPEENILLLKAPDREEIDRQTFESSILRPVARHVQQVRRRGRVRAIVTFYGVPLKIAADPEEAKQAKAAGKNPAVVTTRAAVDSELALVLVPGHALSGPLANPYYLPNQRKPQVLSRDQVLLPARIDGPDPALIRRRLEEAWQVETQGGLNGVACFDARWPQPDPQADAGDSYRRFDRLLHLTARLLERHGHLPVRLDQHPGLVDASSCPDSIAIYCGWYSLEHYQGNLRFAPGSIGYHVASGECATLRRRDSQAWCKRLLEEGAAVTIGPVYEPFLQAFPLPNIFFPLLLEGYLDLGEAFLVSQPVFSWQVILLGDPLYHPFSPAQ